MTKSERSELGALTRKRAKVAKDQVESVADERTAEVEAQLSAIYAADDELWKAATDVARKAVAEANRVIAEQWEAAGKPPTFTPQARFMWIGRGENGDKERRTELRAAARTRIAADAKKAKATIEATCVEVETELVRDSLTTAAAHVFLTSMPRPAELMPRVDVESLHNEMTVGQSAAIEAAIDRAARWAT